MVPVAVSLPAAQLPLPPRPHHRHPRAHVRRQGRREGEAGGRSQRVLWQVQGGRGVQVSRRRFDAF